MNSSINLCQVSSGTEDDWKALYETAFPFKDRHPVEDLRKLFASGQCLLHKTTNANGELLCFSIVNVMSNFTLLSYIATDSTKRSSGVGSKHMKRLIEIIRAAYPSHVAMFLEIESTKQAGLSPEAQMSRTRRLSFYQRLGVRRWLKDYFMPSYGTHAGTKAPTEGELLWFEFSSNCVSQASLAKVIEEIYLRAYNVGKKDPTLQRILSQFQHLDGSPASDTECGGIAEHKPSIGGTRPGGTKKPTEPAKPVDPAQPAQPAKPAEAAKPAETTKPVESEKAVSTTSTTVVVKTEGPKAETTKGKATECGCRVCVRMRSRGTATILKMASYAVERPLKP